jgi:hypothetical protein
VFIPARHIAIAATIAGVALLSYLAGSSRARGGAGSAPEAAAGTPADNPTTAAAPQPRPVRPAPERATGPAPVTGALVAAPTAPLSTQNPPRNASTSAAVPAPVAARATTSAGSPSPTAPAPAPTAVAAPPVAVTPTPAPAPAVSVPAPAPAPAPTITAATPAEPDRELASGGWAAVDRGEAATVMGGTIGAIQGLPIESITRSLTGSRPRVRVVQLTAAGERIVLTETRAGTPTRTPGPAVVTAVRVMPPSEAYPFSTGTVSLGNLLITAKSSMAADALRPLLERMGEIQ